MSNETDFCRTLLTMLMPDVKKVTTPAERKAAWVYRINRTWVGGKS